ncbi:MAG: hypothetical protein GXX04_00255 [Clostridiaceae bacterium]|nr:hypothetical protein [Clostridiaceae bacterium]
MPDYRIAKNKRPGVKNERGGFGTDTVHDGTQGFLTERMQSGEHQIDSGINAIAYLLIRRFNNG